MRRHYFVLIFALLVGIVIGGAAFSWRSDSDLRFALTPNDNKVVAKGRAVYEAKCASCHGKNLEGQSNWRRRDKEGYLPAPPHDASGHTWHHSDKQLFELTKFGLGAILGDENFKTRMPAYERILSDHEIVAALSYIKSQWPKAIQARHDKLNAARADQ